MTTFGHHETYGESGKRIALGLVSGGTALEWIGGAAAIVLSIIAIWYASTVLFGIIVLCLAAALFLHGLAVSARLNKAISDIETTATAPTSSGGMTAELFAGCVGIVLGILILFNIAPLTLSIVSVLVFGGTLAVTGYSKSMNPISMASLTEPEASLVRETVAASGNSHLLVGLGLIALGVLALANVAPVTLCIAAFLSLGGLLFLSGGAVSARMIRLLSREHKR